MEVYLDLNLVIFGPRSFKFFVIVDIEVTDKFFIKKIQIFFQKKIKYIFMMEVTVS